MSQLQQQLGVHGRLRELIAQRFPDVDEETLRDTLEGLTNLNEMLAEIVRSELDDEVLADALRQRLSDMRERLTRLEVRIEVKRATIAFAMEEAKIPRLTLPEATVSLRELPPRLVVTDEGAIPGAYWRPQAPKLDRKSLTDALKAGLSEPGALLSNGGVTIAVRVK